jgi:hypothetical protein
MTQEQALAELARLCAPNTPPVIPADDLLAFLDTARRPSMGYRPDNIRAWAAGAPVAVGEVRAPTRRNFHFYIVTTAGTTGISEPAWLLDTNATLTDGTVEWQEGGLAYWAPSWDLNLAAALAWEFKAANASGNYAISDTGQSLSRNQVYEHCEAQARKYRGRRMGDIRTGMAVLGLAKSVYPNAGIAYQEP